MPVQSFADRRPDRLAWPDRRWEWATLRPENGTFDATTYAVLVGNINDDNVKDECNKIKNI